MSSPPPPPHPGSVPAQAPVAAEFESDGCWVLQARGDLDSDTVDPLFLAMWEAAASHDVVVLDTAAVTFADSTFLSLLIQVHQQTELRIAAPGTTLRRLLGTAGVDHLLDCYSTLEEALAAPR
ncbi:MULTISPECIES: STAS domain-containing protein [Streptomyces]|uniref:STAS domain-containing protein n=1 Tax=Streptomyces TaxID=1883 RepID=UPI0004C7018E|nr:MULTISPECIES: STAS domain-containing protein [unclassified Streptomyces]KPC84196.1 anti-sigma factor antagonist [Streptomyces sp. NRRL S-4]